MILGLQCGSAGEIYIDYLDIMPETDMSEPDETQLSEPDEMQLTDNIEIQ